MSNKFNGIWIPTKERQPAESGQYMVQYESGVITDCHFSKMYQKWNAHDYITPKYALDVVAWMELPPKYVEE